MNPDFASIPADCTAGDALERVRGSDLHPRELLVVCVVDGSGKLTGAVSLAELMLADRQQRVGDLVDAEAPDPTVALEADLPEVALVMADYNLVAIPVVDSACKPVGLISVDDVLEGAGAGKVAAPGRLGPQLAERYETPSLEGRSTTSRTWITRSEQISCATSPAHPSAAISSPLASVSQRLTLALNTATSMISQVATPATPPASIAHRLPPPPKNSTRGRPRGGDGGRAPT